MRTKSQAAWETAASLILDFLLLNFGSGAYPMAPAGRGWDRSRSLFVPSIGTQNPATGLLASYRAAMLLRQGSLHERIQSLNKRNEPARTAMTSGRTAHEYPSRVTISSEKHPNG
jgi:hypothetical protein